MPTLPRIPLFAFFATLFPAAAHADVPVRIGNGWADITWHDPQQASNKWNIDGAFVFTLYPGQFGALTVVDGGYDHEEFEVFNHGVSMGVSYSNSTKTGSSNNWDYDGALSGSHDRFTPYLPPGEYRLTFLNRKTKPNFFDPGPGFFVRAGIKVEIVETPDADEDRLADQFETHTGIYVSPVDTGTDPNKPDTDGDGLDDREEVFVFFTDPNKPDTDGDGFLDSTEIAMNYSPINPDSKPPVMDIRTAVELTITTEIGKNYQIEWSEDLSEWTALPEVLAGDGKQSTRFYSTKEYPKARYFRAAVVPAAQP